MADVAGGALGAALAFFSRLYQEKLGSRRLLARCTRVGAGRLPEALSIPPPSGPQTRERERLGAPTHGLKDEPVEPHRGGAIVFRLPMGPRRRRFYYSL